MELPVIENVHRCTVNQHVGAFAVANVFHVRCTTEQTPAVVAAGVANAWADDDGISLGQSTQVKYDNVTVTPLDGVTGSAAVDFSDAPRTEGQQSNAPTAVQVAMVLSFKTAIRGRSGRGRMYVCGLPVTYQETGEVQWGSSIPAAAVAWYDGFAAVLLASTGVLTFGIASYKLAEFNEVTSRTADVLFGTQRMRARP